MQRRGVFAAEMKRKVGNFFHQRELSLPVSLEKGLWRESTPPLPRLVGILGAVDLGKISNSWIFAQTIIVRKEEATRNSKDSLVFSPLLSWRALSLSSLAASVHALPLKPRGAVISGEERDTRRKETAEIKEEKTRLSRLSQFFLSFCLYVFGGLTSLRFLLPGAKTA